VVSRPAASASLLESVWRVLRRDAPRTVVPATVRRPAICGRPRRRPTERSLGGAGEVRLRSAPAMEIVTDRPLAHITWGEHTQAAAAEGGGRAAAGARVCGGDWGVYAPRRAATSTAD